MDLGLRVRHYLGNSRRFVTAPWRQRVIPIGEATSLFACSFGRDGWHPFVKTLEEYEACSEISWKKTTLYKYHKGFCPKSIIDLIDNGQRTSEIPIFSFPWGTFRIGASNKDVLTSRFCGPSADELIKSEFNALVALYKNISRQGYRPWDFGYGFIGGTFLLSADGKRRFVVLQGNHRMAVLSALGYKKITVRTNPGYLDYIRESDMSNWARVREGSCDIQTARSVFRLYFDKTGEHVRRILCSTKHSPGGEFSKS